MVLIVVEVPNRHEVLLRLLFAAARKTGRQFHPVGLTLVGMCCAVFGGQHANTLHAPSSARGKWLATLQATSGPAVHLSPCELSRWSTNDDCSLRS
jgi:hypothetical protein